MRLEAKKYLYDIQQAASRLTEFSAGKDYSSYASDTMLRSAVERQFEIIGEALRCLAKEDPATASRIADYKQIVAFRNILIHGYAQVDNKIVWDILTTKLPPLIRDVESLLQEA